MPKIAQARETKRSRVLGVLEEVANESCQAFRVSVTKSLGYS